MNIDYELKMLREGSRITTELTGPGLFGNVRETIYRRVADTEEAGVKQALIEMGWSPPGALAEAVAVEREASAVLVEETQEWRAPGWQSTICPITKKAIAAAIRARGAA